MKCKSYMKFFSMFSNDTRLRIMDSLSKSEKSVSDIVEDIQEEQSKVSHNLRALLKCSFVNCSRQGKKRIYSLNKETIRPIMDIAKSHVSKNCKKEDCWVRFNERDIS